MLSRIVSLFKLIVQTERTASNHARHKDSGSSNHEVSGKADLAVVNTSGISQPGAKKPAVAAYPNVSQEPGPGAHVRSCGINRMADQG